MRSMSVSLRLASGHDVLGLWNGPGDPRTIDLDDEHLLFEVEGKASAVASSAESTGV